MITPLKDLRRSISERNRYVPQSKARRKVLDMGNGVTRTVAKAGDIHISTSTPSAFTK
jgi:hypothetical protein